MSRIAKLIAKLCPNGIEYVKLEDVCTLVTGATPSKTNPEYWENGTVPWMSSGEVNNKVVYDTESKITQLGYDKTSTTLVPIHTVVIALAGQGKTRGKVAITEIELCTNQSLCSIICGDKINYKFLYHYLDSKYEELREISNGDGTRGGLSLRILKPYTIPLPPLEMQIELVRILDEYSASVTALQQELENELTTRKKQYEYYRDLLLGFGVHGGGASECEWRTLGAVCTIKGRIGFRGYTRNDMVEKGQGAISFSPANIINHTVYYNDNTYISWEKYEESPEIMVEIGNVLLCKTGSTLGKTAIIDYLPEKATINPQLVVLKNIHCNSRFLKYFLTTFYFQNELQKRKGLGSVPNISQKELGDIMIPIPPAKEQKRIVSILDRFDKLCNDISEGLPAEIEARRKQYEYYRDKMLSFNEA